MKKFYLYGVIAIVAIITILGLVSPKQEVIERSVTVNKPITEVYEYLKSLENMKNWSPWSQKDPNVKNEYFGVQGTVGSSHKWESTHPEVGSGNQKILELITNQKVGFELNFITPYKSTALGAFLVEAKDQQTKVTWQIEMEYNFVQSIVNNVFHLMDKMVGADFEKGLSSLKEILES